MPENRRKILVTGATGQTSGSLVRLLATETYTRCVYQNWIDYECSASSVQPQW